MLLTSINFDIEAGANNACVISNNISILDHPCSMLTINSDGHDVMKYFQRLEDEKRSIVLLKDLDYLDGLNADPDEALGLLKQPPSESLVSEARLVIRLD